MFDHHRAPDGLSGKAIGVASARLAKARVEAMEPFMLMLEMWFWF